MHCIRRRQLIDFARGFAERSVRDMNLGAAANSSSNLAVTSMVRDSSLLFLRLMFRFACSRALQCSVSDGTQLLAGCSDGSIRVFDTRMDKR